MQTTLDQPIEVTALQSAKPVEQEFDSQLAEVARLKTTAESITVTDENDKNGMKLARVTRLTLREIRIGVEKRRKELKEDYLRKGQRIDAAARAITSQIELLEERLLAQEQFAERLEAERKAQRQSERVTILTALGAYHLAAAADLGAMSDADWDLLHADAKALKAARDAEEQRQEEARIAAEKAAEEEKKRREQELLEARQKAEQERKAREAAEAAAKKEREAAAKQRAKLEAQAAAAKKAADMERMAREAAERKAAEEARQKAEQEKKAAMAPDVEKIRSFAERITKAIPQIEDAGLAKRVAFVIKTAAAELQKIADS